MKRKHFLSIAGLVFIACSKPADSKSDSAAVATYAQSSPSQKGTICPPVTDAQMAEAIGEAVTEKMETKEGHCLYM